MRSSASTGRTAWRPTPSGCRPRRTSWWRRSRRSGAIWRSWRRRGQTCALLWRPLPVRDTAFLLNTYSSFNQLCLQFEGSRKITFQGKLVLNLRVWTVLFSCPVLMLQSYMLLHTVISGSSTIYNHVLLFVCWTLFAELLINSLWCRVKCSSYLVYQQLRLKLNFLYVHVCGYICKFKWCS